MEEDINKTGLNGMQRRRHFVPYVLCARGMVFPDRPNHLSLLVFLRCVHHPADVTKSFLEGRKLYFDRENEVKQMTNNRRLVSTAAFPAPICEIGLL